MRTTKSGLMGLALLLVCLLSPLPAVGQTQLPPAGWQQDTPQIIVEGALGDMVRGDHDKGFKALFGRGRYPQATLEKIQFEYYQVVKQQGNPMGYEKVLEQKAGSSVVRCKYVLLFKTQPMMFDLYYYNPDKEWLLKTFTISRDIKKVFDQ
jgi:hypothetical protein